MSTTIPKIAFVPALATLAGSLWVLVMHLMHGCDSASDSQIPNHCSGTAISEQYRQVLLASAVTAGLGALAQMITSILNFTSGLGTWGVINLTVIPLHLASASIPFTLDPFDDSYLGLEEFLSSVRTRAVLTVQYMCHDTDDGILGKLYQLFADSYTPFFFVLVLNIIFSVILLLLNLVCICCSPRGESQRGIPEKKAKVTVENDSDSGVGAMEYELQNLGGMVEL